MDRSRALLIVPLVLVGLLAGAASAQAQLTTLYSNLDGPRTVTGVDSHPIGPSDLGVFRIAAPFTPTASGQAQLLSMRGRCVVPWPKGAVCANMGKVTVHADAGGRPAAQPLATMGYYLLEGSEGSWEVRVNGHPTGGTFRLKLTVGGVEHTSSPIPYNSFHRDFGFCEEFLTIEEVRHCIAHPEVARRNLLDRLLDLDIDVGALSDGQFPDDPAYLRLNGTVAVTDVQLTGGVNPSVSVSQPMIEEECGTLSPAPQLVKGRTYWAVMSAGDAVGWDDWTNDTANVLESVDGAGWKPAVNRKMPALRIDGGSTTCDPVAMPNPTSGTDLGEMILHPGQKGWTSIALSNRGVAPLALGGATFENEGDAFTLMDGEPSVLARPARLKPVGIGGTALFYPTCNGNVPEDWYRSTLVIETSDPQRRQVRYPISCLVDGTPPRIDFSDLRPNGKLGWFTASAHGHLLAKDPESDDMVKDTRCTRAGETFDGGRLVEVTLTVEGEATLECTSTDIADNTGTVQHTVKIDTRRPVVRADVSPAMNADGWSNAPQVTVRFPCTDPVPGSGVASPSAPGGTVTNETTGTTFDSGTCTDVAGLSSDPVQTEVKIDRTAPAITAPVVPAPNAAGWNRTDPTVAFSCADEGIVRSGIKTDTVADAVVAVETPGTTITSAGHCVDRAGNEAVAVTRSVKVDKTEPSTALDRGPSGATTATAADFQLSGADKLSGLARLECRLDGAAFSTCTSSVHLQNLTDGAHTFSVRAVDVAGNVDTTPATRSWTVDTVAPETSVDSGPAAVTASRSASLHYSADALGGTTVAGWECRLDNAPFASCAAGGRAYSGLGAGAHRFEVRARDAAGNVDATAAVHTWTIDLSAPASRILESPDPYTVETTADFAFEAFDTGGSHVAQVECRLDGGAFAPCTSPVHFTGLDTGPHTFAVRATDAVGNVQASPAVYAWKVGTVFAIDDDAAAREDTPLTIDVQDNDVSLTAGPVTMRPDAASSAKGGSVTAAGDGLLRYAPPADFNGTDRFTYTLSNGGDVSSGTVTVDVAAVNDAPAFVRGAPVAVAEDSGHYSAAWATGLRAGPRNESPQKLRFAVEQVSNRTLFSVQPALSPTGVLTFTPAPDANGSATLRVRLVDDGGGNNASPPVNFKVTVRPVNDAPTVKLAGVGRCGRTSATLLLRLNDVDSSTLTLAGSAPRGPLGLALTGAGAERTLKITRLASGRRATARLQVSDGVRASSLRIRVAVGTRRADTLRGRNGTNLLLGLGGRDTLRARGGDDVLCGGGGRDTLLGGPGADFLIGGPGRDRFPDRSADDTVLGPA